MITDQAIARGSALTPNVTILFAGLGLIDIALLGVIGSDGGPPLGVSLLIAGLGLITLGALLPANRGSGAALRVIITVRIISALLAIPAFLLGAPAWVMVLEGLLITGTVLALLLLRRSRPAQPAVR
jgi:hypothetical protein